MASSSDANGGGEVLFSASSQPTPGHPLLFGIDLEDLRALVPDGERYEDRLPLNTERFLGFLRRHRARATFFVVGQLARTRPSLIRDILSEGHEIASHGRAHIPLPQLGVTGFRDDLKGCLEDLAHAGAEGVAGFRAPGGSLVRETRWAYDVLREMGFEYSSSVVATHGVFHGWPEFGPDQPRQIQGVWELPLTLSRTPVFSWPLLGGVYFRITPGFVSRWLARRIIASGDPIITYLHPHDIDEDQERFMHPQIGDNPLLNRFMYVNRGRTLDQFERLMSLGMRIVRYCDYVAEHAAARAAPLQDPSLPGAKRD